MAHRIAVASILPDSRARGYLKAIRAALPRARLREVAVVQTYTVDAALSPAQLRRAGERLANPLTERYEIATVPAPKNFSYAVEIGFLPGVTDNAGRTARETIEDAVGKKFRSGEEVYSSVFLFLVGPLSRNEVQAAAGELHNLLIERASVYRRGAAFPVVVPKVKLGQAAHASVVDLGGSDEELSEMGRRGILDQNGARRGPLALSLPYMKAIRDHFRELGREATDIELESLAQTWSEHCKHTIFADPLDEVKEGIYRRYIKGATQKIRKGKGKRDFCVSVFTDNSGAIAFDDDYLVTHKVETHNSPSALDPYGGAVTGIVGVNRDALGFGLAAKPIANTFGFCVGDPRDTRALFRDEKREQPLLSPRRMLEGVVRGINAGGNQSGIPTPLGFVATDQRYSGKPLVFAGTVGLIPRKVRGKKAYEKKARAGDLIVMMGGRVGLDGIHGATFSSEALSSGSPATAVQIGDPITQKKLSDLLIREARDRGLYRSITDNGAGGLSCSVAEMARESGGCEVELDRVPLKYPGLAPWQVWISESQERMTLSVPKNKLGALKKLCARHDVEASAIGTFTDSGRCVVRSGGKKVMDMDMDFLHDGRPVIAQRGKRVVRQNAEPPLRARAGDLKKALLGVLARPSVGGISFISRQYDHEVQGSAITKPLEGRGQVNADAGVLRPRPDSSRGIVLSQGYCPWYSDIDTYHMAAASIDTAVRNAICAGASLDELAILDNFCWSTSNTPERLYELKRAAKACYDIATSYGTPFVSGKDSMFNDFRGYTKEGEKVHVAVPPTLLISSIGVVPDVSRAVTIDFKMQGDAVYLMGETRDELGASEYFALLSERSGKEWIGNTVPKVHARANKKTYKALARAIQEGMVASATPVGRGGLAVALAKAAVSGGLGLRADLTKVPGDVHRADGILFSESQGRVVVSVRPGREREFEKLMRGVSYARLGEVTSAKRLSLSLPKEKLSLSLSSLARAYRAPFKDW